MITAAPSLPRRTFIKSTAGLAAATALGGTLSRPLSAAERQRSIGANDRIRIGIIGCGNRGRTAHMEGIQKHVAGTNFEVVAVCDPWRLHREQAAAMAKEWYGRDAKQFVSYRDLLAMDGIDAVMISSPDHLHTLHLEAAAKAGKHIYAEKPIATEMAPLVRAVDAVKAAGTIVQVGTQLRSYPGVVGAREVIQGGVIGKITRIEEVRNSPRPYWYQYLDRGVKQEDVDWKEFLGDRPMRPFNPSQYQAWYGYWEFSQGPVAQWGAHFLDTMNYVMGSTFPESCMSMGGTTYWKDENKFTAPDTVIATWMYPEGFMITSSNSFGNSSGNTRKFFGDKGVLKMDNWNAPAYSADGGPKRDGSIRGENLVTPVERPDHFLNWLQCMRSGETPHASIDAGFQHGVAVLMATVSYETGRKTIYDPGKREIRTV
ncbi:MAG: Gfo/Idh/MocA family oxidoreductase [Opitutus sp.]